MNVPLVIGEACLEINEKLQEVMSRLRIKAEPFPETSKEYKVFHQCIGRLNDFSNQFYAQILNEFLSSVGTIIVADSVLTQDKKAVEETVTGALSALCGNFEKISSDRHQEAFELLKTLDNEDKLTGLLRQLLDPTQVEALTESLSKLQTASTSGNLSD